MTGTPRLTLYQVVSANRSHFAGQRKLFGLRVRELRKANGWTLSQLSERTNLSVSYLSDIERGAKNSNPTLYAISALALVFCVSIAQLFDEEAQ